MPVLTDTPLPTISVDWDNNADFIGTYDNISADVDSFTWANGGGTSGKCEIRLKNDSGKYTPDNASGVLYGKLLPGKPVWITATYSGSTYGVFAGYLRKIVPIPRERTCELICEDVFQKYDRIEPQVALSDARSMQ